MLSVQDIEARGTYHPEWRSTQQAVQATDGLRAASGCSFVCMQDLIQSIALSSMRAKLSRVVLFVCENTQPAQSVSIWAIAACGVALSYLSLPAGV